MEEYDYRAYHAPALKPWEREPMTMTDTSEKLPIVTHADAPKRLAEPPPDAMSLHYAQTICKAVDDHTARIVNELDDFAEKLEEMRRLVVDGGEAVKKYLMEHFKLAAEASEFTKQIDRRLTKIANGDSDYAAKEEAAPGTATHPTGNGL